MPVVDHPDSKVRDQPAPNFDNPAAPPTPDKDEPAVITPSKKHPQDNLNKVAGRMPHQTTVSREGPPGMNNE
jgi:hypothetical protein